MKNEAKKNSFKEGLNTIKDHSALSENDWSKLEQRLDRYENHKKTILWSRILGGVAALLLLVLFWWLLQPTETVQPTQETVKEKRNQEIEEPVKKPGESIKSPEPAKTKPSQEQQYNFTDQNSYANNAKAGTAYTDSKEILSKMDNRSIIDKLDSLTDFDSNLDQQVVSIQLNSLKPVDAPLLTVKTKIEDAVKPKLPKLSLSLIYAPALNGVNNFSNAKVGNDVGLLLTVGLSKKWSLTTGAVYAKKLYESDFNDYNPVNKDMLQYDPQSVFADCRVLDIPLNVNYTLLNKGKNIISLGTGISSYLMLKEDYRFIYSNNYTYPNTNYSITNQNKHWFSVLNLEAKYQRQISPKFGIGLQPYLKIPLNDIGFANVKLQSLGMAVNFNWNINAFPKKEK